jgi:hypothetical protein
VLAVLLDSEDVMATPIPFSVALANVRDDDPFAHAQITAFGRSHFTPCGGHANGDRRRATRLSGRRISLKPV